MPCLFCFSHQRALFCLSAYLPLAQEDPRRPFHEVNAVVFVSFLFYFCHFFVAFLPIGLVISQLNRGRGLKKVPNAARTNVMIYWSSQIITSSCRLYYASWA